MAVASRKPDSAPSVVPNVPQIQPKDYKSVVYSDDNVPETSLIAYIDGAPWTVNYYSQVVSRDNDLREIDPTQPATYQQYQKIIGLEIRVQNEIGTTYDSESAITGSTGNGVIYPFMIPNINDYFVTDAGDTRKGIFRITNVERKTFNRDSAYAVDYELIGYVEVEAEIFAALEDRSIRTYHFSKDRLIENKQPMLKEEDYQTITNLKVLYKNLVKYYFKTFFNRKYMTLVVPGQDNAVYDSFLVNYVMRLVDTFDAEEIRGVRMIATDNDPYLAQPQIWQCLFEKSFDTLAYSNQKMGLVTKNLFNRNPYLQGLAFSNIDYIIYPNNPDTSLLVESNPDSKYISIDRLQATKNTQGSIASMLTDVYTDTATSRSLIHPVSTDDYYVLSQSFYNDLQTMSILEILVKDYLKRQALDLKKLTALMTKYPKWCRLDQFYYGPILMTLLKDADAAQYT